MYWALSVANIHSNKSNIKNIHGAFHEQLPEFSFLKTSIIINLFMIFYKEGMKLYKSS